MAFLLRYFGWRKPIFERALGGLIICFFDGVLGALDELGVGPEDIILSAIVDILN